MSRRAARLGMPSSCAACDILASSGTHDRPAPARTHRLFIDLAQKIGAQFIAGGMKWGFVSPSCKPYIMR
ncbi:hypothetical protein Y048_6320 [Burkholderia pseudomallei MSHR456]|nr:hypothetical protein Y048_6320 [Burkholderia pseudomallei MSHR456]